VIFSLLLLHQNREISSLVHTKDERRKEDKERKGEFGSTHEYTRERKEDTDFAAFHTYRTDSKPQSLKIV